MSKLSFGKVPLASGKDQALIPALCLTCALGDSQEASPQAILKAQVPHGFPGITNAG